MKKTALTLVAFLMATTAIFAQNKFEGIVKYQVSSIGEVDMPLKPEQQEVRIFVYQHKAYLGNEQQKRLTVGRKSNMILDLSSAIDYMKANDVWESDYEGSGKVIVSSELEQKDIDSLTIPCTEGFYFEYINGETKEIMGYATKKARMHVFGEDGKDNPIDIWYTSEIGPEFDMLLCTGLQGFPLEFATSAGEGKILQYKAVEITKGKVKNTDFMLPEGYDIIDQEAFGKLMKDINDAAELLQ